MPLALNSATLRPLDPRDIDALAVSDDTREFLRRIVERNDWTHKGMRAFVAEVQDDTAKTLVGYAYAGLGYPPYFPALSDDTKQLYLANLEVFEPFRRRGVALRMLQQLRDEAHRLDVQVFRAECAKGWLVAMYERVGFEPVPYKGPRDDYPQDKHQMLEMWLSPTIE